MKNLVLLSIISFLLITDGVRNDYIRIEYVGNVDKTMRVLWISKKKLPVSERIVTVEYDQYGLNCIVNNDEFLYIKKTINSTKHKTFEKKDYNGFKITICENDTDICYFISRGNSNTLFLKANAYLKHQKRNKELIYELKILRTGNVFDDSGKYIGGYIR